MTQVYVLLLFSAFLFGCKSNNVAPTASIKVILDTDMGSDCDDVGALALLNNYHNQGKAEIIAVIYSSGIVPYGAGIIDAINRYYGNEHIPIALYDLLVSKPDSISVFSGFELIHQKIIQWVALGALKASNEDGYYVKDWNFFFNGTAEYTKYLIDNFPQRIGFIDAGSNILTGKSLIHTPSGNIVRTAYRDWLWNVEKKTLDDQRPSWDLMAVYFAIENPEKYVEILSHGYLEFDVVKGCRWHTGEIATNHFFVKQVDGFENEIADYLNKMFSNQ